MAAVPITIVGKDGNGADITIVGLASITGLGVGGGPLPGGGGKPPHPQFPISGGPDPGWPDKPGYPDYITGWPVPIPPPDGGGPIPPSLPWTPKIAWSVETGWVVVLVPAEGTLVPTPSEKPTA